MAERRKRSSARRTKEGRESYMIGLAMDQAQEMLEKHTAPSQIVTHYLKLGTEREKATVEKIRADAKQSESKAAQLESQRRYEESLDEALKAFRTYAGIAEDDDDEDDDYYD
jgi:hypothetical protein